MKKLFFIIIVFLSLIPTVYAQKTVRVSAEYTYVAPANVSPDQAKTTAFERARLTALADEFGTTLSQNTSTRVKNENGDSSVDFLSLSSSEVKGEWIETLEEEVISAEYDMNANAFVIKVKVVGKAREIKSSRIDVIANILRNGTDLRFEGESFNNNDDLYLYFRSPAKGYLAVYLVDESQNAYCLLPYMNDTDGQTFIKAGQEYVFFAADKADEDNKSIVDEYIMTAEKSVENNQIYIIFSTNEFTKANDEKSSLSGDFILPRQLNFADFQKWLSKVRASDREMVLLQKTIQVHKN